jgi:basic membrane lipoprotein Med (substrate-binding protein (PBP1-ABC) superfamily)
MTKTNKVGFIAGIRLPDFIAALNAVHAAAKEANPAAEVKYAFTGDQNDAGKALQSAQAMVGEGCDVILSMLDRAVLGVIEAAKAAPRPTYFAGFDTDWSNVAPNSFVGALFLDFPKAYGDIAREIIVAGKRTGDYEVRPGQAMALEHIRNVPPNVLERVNKSWEDVAGRRKTVPDVTDKILF